MKERFEFRVREKYASQLFGEHEGRRIQPDVRVVWLDASDPRFAKLGELHVAVDRSKNESVFYGWEIVRRYTKQEISESLWWHVIITSAFDPAGEECGTEYSVANACPRCMVGSEQIGLLRLSRLSIPRGKDISRSIGGEVVVSSRFAAMAAEIGVEQDQFCSILDQRGRKIEGLKQLKISKGSAEIVSPTVAGTKPFMLDDQGEYKCPAGHVIGLSLLSEVYFRIIQRADLMLTRQAVGWRMGVLRPEHRILVSKRFADLIRDNKIRGCRLEVAHLVDGN